MSFSSTRELGPVTLGMWDTRVASSCSQRVPSLPISPLPLWSRTVQAGGHEGGWGSSGVGVTPMPCGHRAPLLGPALGAQVGLLSHGLCVLCTSGSLWHFSNLLSCR